MQSGDTLNNQRSNHLIADEDIEGLDINGGSWGDYPLDDLPHPTRKPNDLRRPSGGSTKVSS